MGRDGRFCELQRLEIPIHSGFALTHCWRRGRRSDYITLKLRVLYFLMTLAELKATLLGLSPDEKRDLIQFLANSLTRDSEAEESVPLSVFFQQSPLTEVAEDLDLTRDAFTIGVSKPLISRSLGFVNQPHVLNFY